MSESADKLIELAKNRFGLITRAERKMLVAVITGKFAEFSYTRPNKNIANNIDLLAESTQRTISADVLRWLCTSKEATALVSSSGIAITNALIIGELNLTGLNVPFNLGFFGCEIKDGIVMQDAQVQTFGLDGSYCKYLIADRLRSNGSVHLRFGFRAEGPVILNSASIKGALDCIAGTFINPASDDKGLSSQRILGKHSRGVALAVERSSIEGVIALSRGFLSRGQVRLNGATINGTLDCTGGYFDNKGKISISGELVKVRGSVIFTKDESTNKQFQTNGDIILNGSSIGGALNFRHATFIEGSRNGVELRNAVVGGPFIWRDVIVNRTTRLRLSHTKVGQLFDKPESWPRKNRLSINGLVYDDIRGAPIDSNKRKKWLMSRIDWLGRQPRSEFSLQPFRQLADALRRTGYEDNARTVLINMYDVRRKRGGLSVWGRFWSVLLKWTIGYGYRSHRAFIWALAFVLVGSVVFYEANQNHLIIPAKADSSITRFNPFAYSLDTFLPIINLRQRESWIPNGQDSNGFMVQVYLWIHIIVGWILTTLGVAGFTGLVKKE
jgi:hypothetical protein